MVEEKNNFVIMVADDDRGVRLTLRLILEGEGYIVVEAEDGVEALALFDATRPDMVLMDCMMPRMDGFNACALIRESGKHRAPVLMITGLDDEKSVDLAFEAGATDFITKPIHWAVLRNRVRHLLYARQTEEKLGKAHRKLQDIIEFLPDATFVLDENKKVIAWNRAIEEMTGVGKEEMIGKSDYAYAVPFYGKPRPILIDLIYSGESSSLQTYKNIEKKGCKLTAEIYVPSFNQGKGAFLWLTASPLLDYSGNTVGAIESIRDITERKQMEDQLKHLSLYDPLTGLYNRTFFEEEMRRLEAGPQDTAGILMCDVDGLKLINDTLGHNTGDSLLIQAAGIIKKCFRDGDMVARVGGDEFAILLPGSGRLVLENACRKIRGAISDHNHRSPEFPLSISVGFAASSDLSKNIFDLYKEADNSMYREKLHRSRSARSAIVKTLMKALEERDYITEGHGDRLQNLVEDLARSVDLTERNIADLRLLAQFHDIGKVGIPDRILFKPGPLTLDEAQEMQRHCEIGYRIARSAPDLAPIADWVLKHHEWWSGKGYPLKLKGEEIPLECRILSIADAYDAMTSDRPYRKAMPRQEAVSQLIKFSGTQFDPLLVKKFVHLLNIDQQHDKKMVF